MLDDTSDANPALSPCRARPTSSPCICRSGCGGPCGRVTEYGAGHLRNVQPRGEERLPGSVRLIRSGWELAGRAVALKACTVAPKPGFPAVLSGSCVGHNLLTTLAQQLYLAHLSGDVLPRPDNGATVRGR